jgi:hypothetical protein
MCGDGYRLHKVARLKWRSKREVEVVIQVLNARNESAAEIHCQLVAVYVNMMVQLTVVKWPTLTASTPQKTNVQDTIIKK